ncbi:MAG: hypothetical protein KDI33_11560 [Halioglobus sp.]|nr:hypothetical protein [Halioglobus sp.]
MLVLQSVHLRYKPAGLEWAFYDPTFVYALEETPEALARASCRPDTVVAFGSSPLDAALARRSEDWRRREKWRRYEGALDDTQRIYSIVRTKVADLRMFYPVLSLLPDCNKIVVISAGTLLPRSFEPQGILKSLKSQLFDSPVYYYSAILERFWPPSYRIDQKKSVGPITRARKPFRKARFEHFYQQRGEFHEIVPAHRDIILELVANNAQVVILDIDRSREWETAGAAAQTNFRRILKAFADSHESIHYRHFEYLDTQYYLDFGHLNERGADIVRPWLAVETAEIARDVDELQ